MIREKLKKGSVSLGSWISLGSTAVAEIFARSGFDWLVIDLEHSVINIDIAGDLIRTIELCGVSPLVRLTSNNPDQIKRVMDAGAHGIVVPMVNSQQDAINAVAATRYYPHGNRGVGLARAQGYGSNFAEYYEWQKEGPLVIVQIEHIDGLNHLEDIFSVKGVDAYMTGPYDLSSSMGIPGDFNSPKYIDAINHITSLGRQMNCPSGIHIVEPNKVKLTEAIDSGFNFIAYSVDIRMLDVSARESVDIYREIKK